jgi:hypothetical protein
VKPILQGRETSELLEEFQPCFMPCVDSSSHMLLTKYWGETEAQLLTEECFSCGIASNRVNPICHFAQILSLVIPPVYFSKVSTSDDSTLE